MRLGVCGNMGGISEDERVFVLSEYFLDVISSCQYVDDYGSTYKFCSPDIRAASSNSTYHGLAFLEHIRLMQRALM